MHRNAASVRCDLERTRFEIPIIGHEKAFDCISRTHVFGSANEPPNFQWYGSSGSPPTGPKRCEVSSVICVQMNDEDLRQVFSRDHQRVDVSHRTGAEVKNQFLPIAKLEKETG